TAVRSRSPSCPHLTHHAPFPRSLTTTVFSQRSTGWFDASPEGRRRRATTPSSPAQHHIKRIYLHRTPLRARGALKIKLVAACTGRAAPDNLAGSRNDQSHNVSPNARPVVSRCQRCDGA